MEFLGYVITFAVGVPFFFALVAMTIVPLVQRSKAQSIFANWYVTRNQLIAEPDRDLWNAPYNAIHFLPQVNLISGFDENGQELFVGTISHTPTNPRNRRQGWLPSGEEVAL